MAREANDEDDVGAPTGGGGGVTTFFVRPSAAFSVLVERAPPLWGAAFTLAIKEDGMIIQSADKEWRAQQG